MCSSLLSRPSFPHSTAALRSREARARRPTVPRLGGGGGEGRGGVVIGGGRKASAAERRTKATGDLCEGKHGSTGRATRGRREDTSQLDNMLPTTKRIKVDHTNTTGATGASTGGASGGGASGACAAGGEQPGTIQVCVTTYFRGVVRDSKDEESQQIDALQVEILGTPNGNPTREHIQHWRAAAETQLGVEAIIKATDVFADVVKTFCVVKAKYNSGADSSFMRRLADVTAESFHMMNVRGDVDVLPNRMTMLLVAPGGDARSAPPQINPPRRREDGGDLYQPYWDTMYGKGEVNDYKGMTLGEYMKV